MARTLRSSQQLDRDRVNVRRMVDRLDATTKRLALRNGAEAQDGVLDHWQLKALQTTIRHARDLLADVVPDSPDTPDMQIRLAKSDERVKAALATIPVPASAPHREFPPPPPPSFPPPTTSIPPPRSSSSGPSAPDLIPLSEHDSALLSSDRPSSPSHPHPNPSLPTSTISPSAPPKAQTATVEKVLSSQRETQDEMTSELSTMATQLRLNAEHFGTLLTKDRAVIESAADALDGNLAKMQKEGGRLGKYSARARGTTCWTILAVGMVAVAWSVMFVIIRVT